MGWKQRLNERIKAATAAYRRTSKDVRSMQLDIYGLMSDYISGRIQTDGGRIKYTAKNLSIVRGIYAIWDRFTGRYEKEITAKVLEESNTIFDVNEVYFEAFGLAPAESVRDAARRITLQRWGYNAATGEIIPGGYLSGLFQNQAIAARLGSLINQAIAAKMPFAQFQTIFRQAFVGLPGGQGMLEAHFKTNSFDLYQRIDRTANFVYAERLGFSNAIYAGTLEEDSRPFCVQRVNKVYTKEEIAAWENLSFQGKPKVGYNPFFDCGGFNCRHHLSWVSDEVAKIL